METAPGERREKALLEKLASATGISSALAKMKR